MPSTSGPPRRHHHHQNFPPVHYTDLRGSDITLLAPIFSPKPASPPSTYETSIRQRISSLPSHLKTKLPILSPFCTSHKSLSQQPILSILSFIQNEITPSALFHWAPVVQSSWLDSKTIALLEEMNSIWTSTSSFCEIYGRLPASAITRWNFIPNQKCAACKLVEVAGNIPGVVALGACVIARLEPGNWRKSKRIQWFEEWIKGSVEREEQGEGVVRVMWECGVRLRDAMGEGTMESSGKGEGRGRRRREYIDDFVAQSSRASTPRRPVREEMQEGHVGITELLMGGPPGQSSREEEEEEEGNVSDTQSIKTIRQRFPATPPPPLQPPQPVSNEPPPPAPKLPTRYIPSMEFFARIQQSFHEDDSRTLLHPAVQTTPSAPSRPRSSVPRPRSSVYSQSETGGHRVTSSIYSRATDDAGDDDDDDGGERRWGGRRSWFRGSVLEEGEFIDSHKDQSSRSTEEGVTKTEQGFI